MVDKKDTVSTDVQVKKSVSTENLEAMETVDVSVPKRAVYSHMDVWL